MSVPGGVFSHLTQCTHLSLANNLLSSLEKGIVTGLVSLEELYLNQNRITAIQPGTFSGLHYLAILYLWENRLSRINGGMFNNLNNLVELALSRNRISAIDHGTFDDLKSLETLYLWGNALSRTEVGLFSKLYNLEKFLLNQNQISYIQDGAFDSLFSIKIFDVAKNRLVSLNADLLVNLPRSSLQLGLSDDKILHSTRNQWNCLSMCWLKYEELQGTIRWWVADTPTVRSPSGAAGVDWNLVQCAQAGQSLSNYLSVLIQSFCAKCFCVKRQKSLQKFSTILFLCLEGYCAEVKNTGCCWLFFMVGLTLVFSNSYFPLFVCSVPSRHLSRAWWCPVLH